MDSNFSTENFTCELSMITSELTSRLRVRDHCWERLQRGPEGTNVTWHDLNRDYEVACENVEIMTKQMIKHVTSLW